MSSVPGLKVTPKNVIFLFLILLFIILLILFNNKLVLLSFELITDFTTERFILNILPVETSALVSFGKHDPP